MLTCGQRAVCDLDGGNVRVEARVALAECVCVCLFKLAVHPFPGPKGVVNLLEQFHCFDAVTVPGSLVMRVPIMSGLSSQNDPTDTSTLNLINFHDHVEND